MVIYSHSKIGSFEQCPQKYKFKYIDKIKPAIEETIEAHLGKCVHETFEWLYGLVMKGSVPTLDEAITKYAKIWEEKYKPTIAIIKKDVSAGTYFEKGVQFIMNYYTTHYPFNDNTIDLEREVKVFLDEYQLVGYIDRLAYNVANQEYEIHDYKTANSLPTLEKIETDRQLALYALAIKQEFGMEKNVVLNWHFLNFNKKITIRKSQDDIETMKRKTIATIQTIEGSKEFPTKRSPLCDWCEFKPYCPAWGGTPPPKKIEPIFTQKKLI